ncbi:hypothetical protein IV203_005682 [Nitzschia inconspicua]|uniref:Uncharacterized protein n=1 Tax=Nitzschia inconspicua TaxID=303405 RepID=A0A9K3KMT6_9STRA|nr:hypothetical protein IV203_005682 [Nitzschia inconspicua]
MPTSNGCSVAKAFVAVRIRGSGVASVNVDYRWTSPHTIPSGFAKVCRDNGWDVKPTWQRLNNGHEWMCSTSNDAYIYRNAADGYWWIDEPGGMGVFIAPISQEHEEEGNEKRLPPVTGWTPLAPNFLPLPQIEIVNGNEGCSSDV